MIRCMFFGRKGEGRVWLEIGIFKIWRAVRWEFWMEFFGLDGCVDGKRGFFVFLLGVWMHDRKTGDPLRTGRREEILTV